MREANIAPFFVCMYPGLADIARANGYALAIHGSVITDMDLIAVPWVDEPALPEVLYGKIRDHVQALDFKGLLSFTMESSEEHVASIAAKEKSPELKPHGRIAWNLYMHHGVKLDLSIMPMVSASNAGAQSDPVPPAEPVCKCSHYLYAHSGGCLCLLCDCTLFETATEEAK